MQNILIYLAMVFIMLQAGGCNTILHHAENSNTPAFGSSVRLAVSEQTANPEAGGDAPVVGIDGKYAAAAAAKYQKGPREASEAKSSSIFGIVDNK
ncbi:MAG: hypothetical protein H0S80_00590 [Desulfovibrionaceae bacterium]|nr:hypothetical protein [Desulfovibrionaceae bacterium]